jgi:integrase
VGIVSKLLDEVLTEYGLHVPPARRYAFASALLKAQLRVLRTLEGREQGTNNGTGEPITTVDALLDAYLRERKLGSKSESEVRAAYKRFSAVVGGFKPVTQVTKADCRAYKESLLAAPSNRSLSKDGKLSAVSVKKLLGICATVFRYGVSQGYLERSPFEGLTRMARGDRGGIERRLPYDASDLASIFGSEAFSKLTAVKRWLPLLSLYSGCRVEEGGGLRVKDVRHDDGVDYLDFTPTTERGLKTASSRRKVPVHPELVRLGFLDYVKRLPQDGRLFPELKPGPHGKLTGAFSKWWARFTDDLGVDDPRKTFHSLRHCFKDVCRAAGLSEEVHDALTGHVSGAVGRTYGTGVPLQALKGAVERIVYSSVLPSRA